MSNSIPGTRWPSGLAYAAALLFCLASAGTNLVYGWNKGTDLPSSLIWSAVSVAVSIVFALSWPAVIGSLERGRWSRASMALVALVLTGTYSVAAALGSASGGRTQATALELAATSARDRAQAAYDAAQAELAKLEPTRTVGELEALLAREVRRRGGCGSENGTGRWLCPLSRRGSALQAELGRAKRRIELEQRVEHASDALAEVGAPRAANSDAAALAAYMSALGFETTTDRLNRLLVLLAVLVIEMGGGLALTVGMALQVAERAQERPARAGGYPGTRQPRPASLRAPVSHGGRAGGRLLEAVRASGGALTVGQESLGRMVGVSRTRAGVLLRQLEADGQLSLTTSHKGTSIRLLR
jgi:hypothetical protein